MRTVYYLTHTENHRRLRYYTSRAGARIAQRQRNHRLGFHTRLERVAVSNLELERCLDSNGRVVDATWAIEEDCLESPDLITEAP
jgi:hypothetical protein